MYIYSSNSGRILNTCAVTYLLVRSILSNCVAYLIGAIYV